MVICAANAVDVGAKETPCCIHPVIGIHQRQRTLAFQLITPDVLLDVVDPGALGSTKDHDPLPWQLNQDGLLVRAFLGAWVRTLLLGLHSGFLLIRLQHAAVTIFVELKETKPDLYRH